ncbi:hypothetical protein HID58_088147 [Brassica napus]|uniref:TF-B3 domain-containing protein n=1 Tax=Brassica napus TaxID=3708 RepID=A0ABQ7XXX7_BRANA|nr:hypothetical protein HID58_088147 [Brassica napus]
MVFTPYPDLLIIYNSQDLSLSQRLVIHFLHSTFVLRGCWSKFITDNDPMDGGFLLFSYDGYRTFLVSIFWDRLPVKPKAPVNIQEISDEDETTGDDANDDDDEEEEDNDQNMIIYLSSGSSEEDNVDTLTKLMEVQGEVQLTYYLDFVLIRMFTSSQRKRAEPIGDPEAILLIPLTLSLSQLRRVAVVCW